jgi:putative transposase
MDQLRGHKALRIGRCSLSQHVYHVSTSTHLRQPLFADFYSARIVARCLNDRVSLGQSQLLAWVVMPDHIHLLVQLGEVGSLSRVVNRLKGSAARAVNLRLGRVGPVWQRAFHDHMLRKEEDLEPVGRYIVANPLRAGLVSRISDYPHWDAVWL